jgi:hypothetical protein
MMPYCIVCICKHFNIAGDWSSSDNEFSYDSDLSVGSPTKGIERQQHRYTSVAVTSLPEPGRSITTSKQRVNSNDMYSYTDDSTAARSYQAATSHSSTADAASYSNTQQSDSNTAVDMDISSDNDNDNDDADEAAISSSDSNCSSTAPDDRCDVTVMKTVSGMSGFYSRAITMLRDHIMPSINRGDLVHSASATTATIHDLDMILDKMLLLDKQLESMQYRLYITGDREQCKSSVCTTLCGGIKVSGCNILVTNYTVYTYTRYNAK